MISARTIAEEAAERRRQIKAANIAAANDQTRRTFEAVKEILRERFGDQFMRDLFVEAHRRMGAEA